jgi:type II secretory pathway component PulC
LVFIDDNDVRPPVQPQAPQVIYQQAPRGLMVPVLLVVLIVCVLGLAVVLALPHLNLQSDKQPEPTGARISELDPKLLMTPSGRKLELVEFGGFLFEVTRVAYHTSASMRTVTITVPGDPPPVAVFHIGDTFAGGKVRISDINSAAVVLESGGETKMFATIGGNLADLYETGTGTQFMPAKGKSAIPDLPAGAERAPAHPIKDIEPVAADEPDEPKSHDTLDALPWEEHAPMRADQYHTLVRELPDLFESDFVLAVALDRETRQPVGLEIKNIKGDSLFYAHGLQIGDVIFGVNGNATRRVSELNTILRGAHFRDEICIEILRGSDSIAYVFYPGEPE